MSLITSERQTRQLPPLAVTLALRLASFLTRTAAGRFSAGAFVIIRVNFVAAPDRSGAHVPTTA